MSPHPFCGSCTKCRDFINRVLTPPPGSCQAQREGRPITRERLEKHAARFGWAGVAEVAAEYGIELEAPSTPAAKAKKTRGPSRRQRVAVLVKDGYSAEKIAAIEEISPSYARRIIAELKK